LRGETLDDESAAFLESWKREYVDLWGALKNESKGKADEEELEQIRAAEKSEDAASEMVRWSQMIELAQKKLISLGVNPAGPRPSYQFFQGRPWFRMMPSADWHSLPENATKTSREEIAKQLSILS